MATSNSIPSNNPISSIQYPFFPSGIGDGKLFDVREGVPIPDALNQASCFLASAKTAAYEADENADFGYAAAYLIELAKALVDSAIESIAGASKQEAAEVAHG